MQQLEGKRCLITGGASGIGAASALRFAEEGARVVVADLDSARGEALAARIGGLFVAMDVSRESSVATGMETAVAWLGGLDCLFNNAGFGGALGPVSETTEADFDLTFDVLVKGVFLGTKHGAPRLAAAGGGSIINTGSVAGILAGWSPHLYSAAKAAVIQLTRSTALELAEQNIRVNCICPGFIATPLAVGRDPADPEFQAVKTAFGAEQPIGRAGEPEDIAHAAAYLASDGAGFITGQVHIVDGGLSLGRSWREQPGWMRRRHEITVHRPPDR